MDNLDELLWNWGRWARVGRSFGGPGVPRIARVIYSSPQGKGHPTGWGDYNPGILPPLREGFDRKSAEMVEAEVSALAEFPRNFLKFHYVYKSDPRAMARKLHFRFKEYGILLEGAKLSLRNRLTRFTKGLISEQPRKRAPITVSENPL